MTFCRFIIGNALVTPVNVLMELLCVQITVYYTTNAIILKIVITIFGSVKSYNFLVRCGQRKH